MPFAIVPCPSLTHAHKHAIRHSNIAGNGNEETFTKTISKVAIYGNYDWKKTCTCTLPLLGHHSKAAISPSDIDDVSPIGKWKIPHALEFYRHIYLHIRFGQPKPK